MHICWHGAVSGRDLATFGSDMPRIGRRLGFAPDVLHTFSGVQVGLSPIDAFLYPVRADQEPIPNPIRVAVVASSEQCEALAMVIKSLTTAANLEMKLFVDEAPARRWLARE